MSFAATTSRFGALRNRGFRRFWCGSLASVGGYQLLLMGQGWLVFELSGSPLDLGYLGAAAALPNIAASLLGGMLADRLDKRRMLMATSLAVAGLLAMLALLDASGLVRVWHVLVIVALIAAVTGIDWPARVAIYPALVRRDEMLSAVALNSIVWTSTRMTMPALGGAILAVSDTSVIFALGAAGFLGMFAVLASTELERAPAAGTVGARTLADAWRFIVGHETFAVLLLLTYVSMLLGTSYMQLLPAVAGAIGASETGYGLLISATGAGSIAGTLLVGPYQRSPYLGLVMLAGIGLAALSTLAFGLVVALDPTGTLWVAIALGFLGALAATVFLVCSMMVMQLEVPDAMRGRVMGIHSITYSLIPLGGLIGGVVAEAHGVALAIAANAGAFLLVVAAAAAGSGKLRRLDGASLG